MKYLMGALLVLSYGLLEGSFSERDEAIRAEEHRLAAEKRAALFASYLAHCFNSGSLKVSDQVIDCKRRRK